MSNQTIPGDHRVEQTNRPADAPGMTSRFDPAMAHICIELFTRATLYAGAIGLIAGLFAALLALK